MAEKDYTKVQPISLKDFQEMFADIYKERNKRNYSTEELLIRINEEASKIDKMLRRSDSSDEAKNLSRLFAWILAFANQAEIDVEKAIWHKYQRICPYCGKEENCMCITLGTKPQKWCRNREAECEIPRSLTEWQKMFDKIYGNINKMLWKIQVWLHVHEEIGELSEAYRLGQIKSMQEELADVFAWFMAFYNKSKIDLASVIYERYPGKCDVCREEKCQCPKV